jgi:outer membrane receptor protein involved in Fe transport
MKRTFLFVFSLFLYTSILIAQESIISGHVLDAKTGIPLSFASVKINHLNATKVDSLGFFKIKVEAGKYKITISKIGYASLFQTVNIGFEESLNLNFYLESFTNQLNTLVISSSKQEKLLAKETVSIVSIDQHLISSTNANNLSEILNKVPGVSVIEGQAIIRGGVGWSYNVGSRVMVMLDGMPLMGPDVGDVQWDFLPIEAAENIEVLKGPSSVLYGSSATSGTVTLNTGWPTIKPETKIQTYQGIMNNPRTKEGIWWEQTSQPFTSGAFFSHKQKFGQFDLVASGNVDMQRSFIQQNDSYRARFYVKTRYRFEKIKGLQVGLSVNTMFKKAGHFFLWGGGDTGYYKPWQGSTGQDFYRIWSVDPYITYTKPNDYTLTLRLQHYNITRFVDTTQYTNNLNNAIANTQALDMNLQKFWFKGFTTTSGAYFSRIWAAGNVYPGDHSGYSAAAFTQADYQYKKFHFDAGLRYEFNALGAIQETVRPLFRAGINYQPKQKTFFRLNYGEGYRFPTIAERYVQDNLKSLSVYPNPDLKSETGWYTEIGLKQGFSVGKNFNASIDFAFFWQEYHNLIEFHFAQWDSNTYSIDTIPPYLHYHIASPAGFKAVNIDFSRTAGAEFTLEGSGKIGELGIRTLCGYTYIYPVDLNADPSLQNFGNYMNGFFRTFNDFNSTDKSTTLAYRNRKLVKTDIEFFYKKFMFGYSANYYSSFDKVDARLDLIIGYSDFLNAHNNGDLVQSVRFGYDISQNVTAAFLINNLDNVEYSIRPARMEPPRTFNLQFKMRF